MRNAIESNSTTKCGHPSKQDVYFSIQSGDPLTPIARGTKSIDIPGYRYNRSMTNVMRSLELRPLLSFLELLNSGRLT